MAYTRVLMWRIARYKPGTGKALSAHAVTIEAQVTMVPVADIGFASRRARGPRSWRQADLGTGCAQPGCYREPRKALLPLALRPLCITAPRARWAGAAGRAAQALTTSRVAGYQAAAVVPVLPPAAGVAPGVLDAGRADIVMKSRAYDNSKNVWGPSLVASSFEPLDGPARPCGADGS